MAKLSEDRGIINRESPILLNSDQKKLLGDLLRELEAPDRAIRDKMVSKWRLLVNYWRGIQDGLYSELAKDWRRVSDLNEEDEDTEDKQINTFKAYGQIIISAIAATVPEVVFFPEDADNPEDLSTARTCRKISHLIDRQNDAAILILRILYTLYTQSFVAIYNYYEENEKFGVIKKAKYNTTTTKVKMLTCPECGSEIDEASEEQQIPTTCPECGQDVIPQEGEVERETEEFAGYEEIPKCKEALRVYGPLNVKIPHYVTEISQTPYLVLEFEEHFARLRELFKEEGESIVAKQTSSMDRKSRSFGDVTVDTDTHLATLKYAWLRPWAFNTLIEKADELEEIRGLFKDGIVLEVVNDEVLNAYEEDLDDHWSINVDPTSEFLHSVPIGQDVVPIQDMTTEVMNIELDTLRHSIPITFADPETLNFQSFKESRAEPGQVFPAKLPSGGQNLASAFFSTQTTTLSKEIDPFQQKLAQMAQFVLGALPSVWGGQSSGGSETAREYEMSRNQALQRLGILYKILIGVWVEAKRKAVKEFRSNIKHDQKYVDQQGTNFVNIWIKRNELKGETGEVRAEASEQFPMSWAQLRGLVLELVGMNNENLNAALYHPNNVEFVSRVLGASGFHIPGEADRNKQLAEIAELAKGAPIEGPPSIDPMTGMMVPGPPQPTVPVDPDIDDHRTHWETTRLFLVSDEGSDLRKWNPAGWDNILAHGIQHMMMLQGMQQPPMESEVPTENVQVPGLNPDELGDIEPAPSPESDVSPELGVE